MSPRPTSDDHVSTPAARAASAPAVLVLGATGGIGRGVVEALLAAGQPVIATGRDPDALAALGERFAERQALLAQLVASLDDEAGGAALAQAVRRLRRPLRAVVASLGGPLASGRLLATPAAQALGKLEADLLPHWIAARHLLPLLAERSQPSRYVVVGGPCADHVWAGYGQCSIGAAALRMFVRALREETADGPVRVQQLSAATPVATWRNTGCACADWPSARDFGERALALIAHGDSNEVIVRFGMRAGAAAIADNGLAAVCTQTADGRKHDP